jgi:hypothetical protein
MDKKYIAALIGTGLLLGTSGVALAQTTATASSSVTVGTHTGGARVNAAANQSTRITTAKSHADQEIQRRITMLNQLKSKVQAMTKISSTEKAAISSMVTAQVASLTTLQTKIDAEADIDALKTDIHSITGSYRIFALIIPRGRIDVAADKINTAATSMTDFAAKLQTRISAATGDTSALTSQLAAMNAKISDAGVQANAAVLAVAGLQPDNGDKSVQSANAAALKNARANIQAALADLKAARRDAGAIVKALKGTETHPSASAATNASTSTQ